MKCSTVLHGDVCHRTSTAYKSRNKMKKNVKFTFNTSLRLTHVLEVATKPPRMLWGECGSPEGWWWGADAVGRVGEW